MRILTPISTGKFSKIVVDFLCSRKLVDTKQNVQIELINVQKNLPSDDPMALVRTRKPNAVQDAGFAICRNAEEKLTDAGYIVKTHISVGKVGRAIADRSNAIHPDLIVMGAHGCTPVKGLLFGSKATDVLSHTTAPLLLLRQKVKFPKKGLDVLVCVDGSAYATAAVNYVISHIGLLGENPCLHVITVAERESPMPLPLADGDYIEEQHKHVFKSMVTPLVDNLRKNGINAKKAYLRGKVANAIVDYAKKNDIGLIVLGSHGRSSLGSVILGSSASYIAAKCDQPLLLVHKN